MRRSLRLTVLTDNINWVAPLVRAATESGDWKIKVVGLDGPFDGLVFNRISSSAGGDLATFQRAPAVLQGLDQVVNGLRCHLIGVSKWAQAELFREIDVKTPETQLVASGELLSPREDCLVKPNVGGFGKGISLLNTPKRAPASLDGRAVVQARITPIDGCVHRLEMVAGQPLYRAVTPILDSTFDYCLGQSSIAGLYHDFPYEAECRRVAEAAGLEIGSVEYLIDQQGEACFIDINPVSTYAPDEAQRSYEAVLRYLGQRAHHLRSNGS